MRSLQSKEENETTEFKRTTAELPEALDAISAMLNKHSHGILYFGLKNDGSPNPFTITDSTLRDVSHKISEKIRPQIYPQVYKTTLFETMTEVIVVEFTGEDGPYSSNGRYFLRVGDENHEMSPAELRRSMIGNEYSEHWEDQTSDNSINDTDEETLQRFFQKGVLSGRLPDIQYHRESLLAHLGLVKGNYLTNAGKVLFSGKRPVVLKMAVFATDAKLTFLDIKRIEGNIFQLIESALLYISSNIRWRVSYSGLQRIETPEIPMGAIRETLVNSFVHARYDIPIQHEIDIFSNRISIINPGSFANPFTPEDYANKNLSSVLRNKKIAGAFYQCKDVETFGSGYRKIYQLCEANRITTAYQIENDFFTFEFFRPVIDDADIVVYDVDGANDIEIGADGADNGANNIGIGTDIVNNSILTADELKIVSLISENPSIKIETIGIMIQKSKRTTQRILADMKEKGIINRVGSSSHGTWEINEK